MNAALETVTSAAQEKGISIEVEKTGEKVADVYGDPTRLQQIFWNLLCKAVRFNTTGGKGKVAPATFRGCS